MKTQDAIKRAGTAKALAELLEITGGAISQWGEDVPEGRRWQLQVLRPQWFESDQKVDPAATPSGTASEAEGQVTQEG